MRSVLLNISLKLHLKCILIRRNESIVFHTLWIKILKTLYVDLYKKARKQIFFKAKINEDV